MLPLRPTTDSLTAPSVSSSLIDGISAMVLLPSADRNFELLSL